MFMNCSKTSQAFTDNKYDSETMNTQRFIDVKEQILLADVRNFRLNLTFCRHYTHVYSVQSYWHKCRNKIFLPI